MDFNQVSIQTRSAFLIRTLFFSLLMPVLCHAQNNKLTLEKAIDIALENNLDIKSSAYTIEKEKALTGTAIDLEKTFLYYNFDQNNLAPNNYPLNVWGIEQSFQFPTVYSARKKLLEEQVDLAKDQYGLEKIKLSKSVSQAYFKILYYQAVQKQYVFLDSLFKRYYRAVDQQYQTGELNYLENLRAKSKQRAIALNLLENQENLNTAYIEFRTLLQTDSAVSIQEQDLGRINLEKPDTTHHPGLAYEKNALEVSEKTTKLQKQQLLPDVSLAYFQGTNDGPNSKYYHGFQAGISVPLWPVAYKSEIDAAKVESLIRETELEAYTVKLNAEYEKLISELRQKEQKLEYYESTDKPLSEELISHAEKAFDSGQIDHLTYIELVQDSRNIEIDYLSALLDYNLTALEIQYLTY